MAAKKKKLHLCEYCKKEFSWPNKKKYCSTDCRKSFTQENRLKKNKLKKKVSKKPKKETLSQLIINKFLKAPKAIWRDKGLKFRELKFVQKLIDIYSLEIFWRALPVPFLADSLAWYLAPNGREYLKVEFAKFSLDLEAPTRHNISAVKFGEDKAIKIKPKTLRDFLKNGSEKENSRYI